ncbi:MAG: class I SAM-dependent methyltransferase, partial [Burkholderiaceae bacterium]
DLGSGDGRIPLAAGKHFGAKALGLEYNPQMVRLAQCYVRAEELGEKVEIREADIFETDFSDATVLTLYLLSDLNLRLRPTILKMKPGTRVVSNSFEMGDWPADQVIDTPKSYTRAYFWIVPAQVHGTWAFREEGGAHDFQLQIEQEFQNIKATVPSGSARATVRDARLRGAEVEFTLSEQGARALSFKGKVDQDTIRVSTRRDGKSVSYVGRRAG